MGFRVEMRVNTVTHNGHRIYVIAEYWGLVKSVEVYGTSIDQAKSNYRRIQSRVPDFQTSEPIDDIDFNYMAVCLLQMGRVK